MGRHSIRFKITLLLTVAIAALMVILLVANNTLAESFYFNDKKNAMLNVYNQIDKTMVSYSNGNIADSEMKNEIDQILSSESISVVVVNSDWTVSYSNISRVNEMVDRLAMSMFNKDIFDKIIREQDSGEGKHDKDGGSINISIGGFEEERDILEENDKYMLQKVYDERLGGDYYEMWGVLGNGSFVMMRMGVQGIRDNVAISNKFITYIGFGVLSIGIIAAYSFSRYFTKPIKQLSDIAERMANMDFDVKYEGNDKSEIGVLGVSMNNMSQKLEENISQLKIANLELQRDIDKKEKLEQMRSDFLSNVSHELKTPIALIQGYAEGLKEGVTEDVESTEFYCDVIIDEALKMNTMVKKLLTLNQIEFGNEELVMERFDVVELIRSIMAANELRASQKNITMEFKPENDVMDVWGDEYKIEEVVTNYITNAINHCEYDLKIIVKAETLNDIVRVSVYNSGKHIPKEDIDNIWIKFYKVDKARTREYGGNGIGLSIVKAIMDSYGKECGVKNVDGGVEFWFDLDAKV